MLDSWAGRNFEIGGIGRKLGKKYETRHFNGSNNRKRRLLNLIYLLDVSFMTQENNYHVIDIFDFML